MKALVLALGLIAAITGANAAHAGFWNMYIPAPPSVKQHVQNGKRAIQIWAHANPPQLATPQSDDMRDYVANVSSNPDNVGATDMRLVNALDLLNETPQGRARFFATSFQNNPATDIAIAEMFYFLTYDEKVSLDHTLVAQPHLSDELVQYLIDGALLDNGHEKFILANANLTEPQKLKLVSLMRSKAAAMGYDPSADLLTIYTDMNAAGGTYQVRLSQLENNADDTARDFHYAQNTHRPRPLRLARARDADDAQKAVRELEEASEQFGIAFRLLRQIEHLPIPQDCNGAMDANIARIPNR